MSKNRGFWYNNYMIDIAVPILLGVLTGYVVNYLSDILPTQRKFWKPACNQCSTDYNWKDYLTIRACQNCGTHRSLRTYISLVLGFSFSIVMWFFPPVHMGFWLGMAVIAYLGLVVVIDLEHRLILHSVSLAGVLLAIILGIAQSNLISTLIGGLVGLGIMLIFYWFGLQFALYRARKMGRDDGEEALGFGDVTISGVLGLLLGWPLIIYGLVIGIFAGGLISLLLVAILIATRRYEAMTVFTAYGPYLVFGASVLIYFPQFLSFLLGK